VNTVMNLRVPQNAGKFLSCCTIGSFSGRTQLSKQVSKYSRGGVQLGPLGTAATNRPIVSVPGDYDDEEIGGMMTGRGNRITRRKPVQVPLCPP
jgi:hypothetical protein